MAAFLTPAVRVCPPKGRPPVGPCHLKGSEGDALQAVLWAACYNNRWLLRMIVKKGLGLLLCLLQACGLVGMIDKLAEFFGRNRLQNSDQRWVLA
jgi:hypothetical protein